MRFGDYVIDFRAHRSPTRCETCGKREWRAWLLPSFWRDTRSALSTIWWWSFWWGPLHIRHEVPEAEREKALAEYNARTRIL